MAGNFPENGLCRRAREWASLRVDGELSELESELLERHLAGCPDCAGFDARLSLVVRTLRTAPPASARKPFKVPAAPRELPRQRILAVAAVIMAAGVGALVGSGLQRPAVPPQAPPPSQVSLLSRDLTQLRQLPRSRHLAPNPRRSVPGGLPEHLI